VGLGTDALETIGGGSNFWGTKDNVLPVRGGPKKCREKRRKRGIVNTATPTWTKKDSTEKMATERDRMGEETLKT